jgi:hypothetical protein
MSWKFSSTKALVKLSCFSSKNLKNSQDSWCIINHQLLGEVWVCFFGGHLSCSILRDFTLVFLQCFFFLPVYCMCNHYLQNIFFQKEKLCGLCFTFIKRKGTCKLDTFYFSLVKACTKIPSLLCKKLRMSLLSRKGEPTSWLQNKTLQLDESYLLLILGNKCIIMYLICLHYLLNLSTN